MDWENLKTMKLRFRNVCLMIVVPDQPIQWSLFAAQIWNISNLSKNNNIFENGRWTNFFVKKEDNINFSVNGRQPQKHSATKNNWK